MLSNAKNAVILLNPFLFMISKPVRAVPVRLTADITISDDVQSLWTILPTWANFRTMQANKNDVWLMFGFGMAMAEWAACWQPFCSTEVASMWENTFLWKRKSQRIRICIMMPSAKRRPAGMKVRKTPFLSSSICWELSLQHIKTLGIALHWWKPNFPHCKQ